jgi:hypothetical protein
MAQSTSTSRFLRLLRRTASTAQKSPPRGVVDENALWISYDRALSDAKAASAAAQRIEATAARQRVAFEATAELARSASARTAELERGIARVSAIFERLGLVALNAGLEGARLGETSGRSLSLVSDEMATLAERGAEATLESNAGVGEAAREASGLVARFDEARAGTSEIGHDAALASSHALGSERALMEMADRLRTATGSDRETVQAVAVATEHARQLVIALGALSGKAPRGLVVGALRPVLEPLMRAVLDEADDEVSE